MQLEHWNKLNSNGTTLSKLEILEGWHYCPEWDGLLIGPDMAELDCCPCSNPEPWPKNWPKTTDRLKLELHYCKNPVTRSVLREIIGKRENE